MSGLEGYLKRGERQTPERRLRMPRLSDYILTPAELREMIADYPDRSMAAGFTVAALVLLITRGLPVIQVAAAVGAVILSLYLVSSLTHTLTLSDLGAAFLVSAALLAPVSVAAQTLLLLYAPLLAPPWAAQLAAPLMEVLLLVLALRLAVGRWWGGALGWRTSASDLALLGACLGGGWDLGERLLQPTAAGAWWQTAEMLGPLPWAGHALFGALLGLAMGRARFGSRGRATTTEWVWLLLLWGWLERALMVGLVAHRPVQVPELTWELLPLARLHGGLLGLALLFLLLVPTLIKELRLLGHHRAVDPEIAQRPGWRGLRPPAGVDTAGWLSRWLSRRLTLARLRRAIAYGFHYTAFEARDESREAGRLLAALRLHSLALQTDLQGEPPAES